MQSSLVERQLPYGVADLFLEQAAAKSQVESRLRTAFSSWGYGEVIPPTFEYYEPLAFEASPQVLEETYRFFDRDGRMLALRADPTIPIARIVGTKLDHLPLPLRLYYVGNVFRYEEPKASLRREFTQAGIELIGVDTPAADAEVIALAAHALFSAGLEGFRLRVGSMQLLAALLDAQVLDPSLIESIRVTLERKQELALTQALAEAPLPAAWRTALARLPLLIGDRTILDEAAQVCSVNDRAQAALERLTAIADQLDAMGLADVVTWDLAMVRGMAYYTGIVFEGFAHGLGFSVVSGGRYDNLIAHFGRDLPALGFAIGVERVLAGLAQAGRIEIDLAPQVMTEMVVTRALAARIASARAEGKQIESALASCSRQELIAQARARGAREVWFADGESEVLE
ncbi:MAG: ATP phosphoribosyltransferase regulatory subunit [Anaerolineae bacterium]